MSRLYCKVSVTSFLWHLAVLLLLATVSSALAQRLVICPHCGREARNGEMQCRHCKATIPPPRTAEEAEKIAPLPLVTRDVKKVDIGRMAMAGADECLREARREARTRPSVALCYYQNALALHRLGLEGKGVAKRGTEEKKRESEIVEGTHAMLARVRRGWTSCRKCKGTGEARMILRKRDGHANKGPVGKCPECRGRGGHNDFFPADQVKAEILRGRREFARARVAAGEVAVGQSFLYPALADALSNRQRALVMTAIPRPCMECGITGQQPCTACKGLGYTHCTAPDCRNGTVEKKKKTTHGVVNATRMNDANDNFCPVCHGTGEAPCARCEGKKNVPCRKCGGSGSAPICRKCTGSGIVPCSKCKGTGETRGKPCSDCKGEGEALCSACGGDGFK